MGSSLSSKLLFIGLDNAGKTSVLNYLKEGPNSVVPKPSVGFETKEIKYKGINFSIFDVAGGAKVRDLWKHYFAEVDAVLWVVDSADAERLKESKIALMTALKDASMRKDCPILIAANKSDLPGSKTEDEIKQALDLENLLRGRHWTVKRTNAKQGDGIYEGFKWLSDEIKADYKRKKK